MLDITKLDTTITQKEIKMSKILSSWLKLFSVDDQNPNDKFIYFVLHNHLDNPSMPNYSNFKNLHKEIKLYCLPRVEKNKDKTKFLNKLLKYLEVTYNILEDTPIDEKKLEELVVEPEEDITKFVEFDEPVMVNKEFEEKVKAEMDISDEINYFKEN